jgi:hypothetical protein
MTRPSLYKMKAMLRSGRQSGGRAVAQASKLRSFLTLLGIILATTADCSDERHPRNGHLHRRCPTWAPTAFASAASS